MQNNNFSSGGREQSQCALLIILGELLPGLTLTAQTRSTLCTLYIKTAQYNDIAVVCTYLSGKVPYRQVGVVRGVRYGSTGGVMVSTLAQNARDVGSIPTQHTIFPIFNTSTTLVAVTMILYKLLIVWLLNPPCVMYTYKDMACMYLIVSIK